MSLPRDSWPQNFSSILALDMMTLNDVGFKKSAAASKFAYLLGNMNVSQLELSEVTVRPVDDGDNDDDVERTKRIVSEFKMPSVKQLWLNEECHFEYFKAALEAGTTSVIVLTALIGSDDSDAPAKLNILAGFIRAAVKLNVFVIDGLQDARFRPPPQFFQALEACATVTIIHVVNHNNFFRLREIKQLQRIEGRNSKLRRFSASPSTYPPDLWMTLMRQFDNCPSGLYMLACHLPEVFSFDELRAQAQRQNRNKEKEPPPDGANRLIS